jgi:hypothetical protein
MTKAEKKKALRSSADLSTLDDFLKEEGTFEEFQSTAIRRSPGVADRKELGWANLV